MRANAMALITVLEFNRVAALNQERHHLWLRGLCFESGAHTSTAINRSHPIVDKAQADALMSEVLTTHDHAVYLSSSGRRWMSRLRADEGHCLVCLGHA
jgi:hypothetical protein